MNQDREIAQDKTNMDVARSLGRIEGNLTTILENQKDVRKILEDHEQRISENENGLSRIQVKIGVVGAFIGTVFAAIGNWLWHKLLGH